MKADENNLKKLFDNVPFDDAINPAHKARLKNAVLYAHMTSADGKTKIWRNAAVLIFAIALGFIVGMQLWREMKTYSPPLPANEPVTVQVTPAAAEKTVSSSSASLWSKDAWEKRLASTQASRPHNRKMIIWTSPTKKPIQGDER